MQKLTYINLHGDAVTFGGAPPYILEHVKGLGKPAVKIASTRGVYQHGDTPRGALLEPRFVDFTFHIEGGSRADLYARREALMGLLALGRALDGERQGRLIYENDHGRWWIYATPDGPDPETRMQNWLLSSKLSFRCADPYWRWEAVSTLELFMSESSFRLPFRFPIRLGNRQFSGQAINAGHADAPVRITIRGSGEKPTLANHTTGAQITIARAVATDETLYIDTDPETLSVVVRDADGTETSAHGYLSLDTPLIGFALRRGINQIEYLPSQPSQLSRVQLSWDTRLEGV
jgi:hypothetical protein